MAIAEWTPRSRFTVRAGPEKRRSRHSAIFRQPALCWDHSASHRPPSWNSAARSLPTTSCAERRRAPSTSVCANSLQPARASHCLGFLLAGAGGEHVEADG